MSSGVPINSARRTNSYAAAALADVDGVKTSFATATSPVVLTAADFNGAAVATGGVLSLPRSLTISRSNNANQFSVEPIVITGKRGSATVTSSVTPANDDGNDILRFDQAFDTVTSIAIPAQGGTGGTFTIGVQDICAPFGDVFTAVKLHAAGTLNVRYGESSSAPTDAIPVSASLEREPIAPTRILTSTALASPTTVGVTVYAS